MTQHSLNAGGNIDRDGEQGGVQGLILADFPTSSGPDILALAIYAWKCTLWQCTEHELVHWSMNIKILAFIECTNAGCFSSCTRLGRKVGYIYVICISICYLTGLGGFISLTSIIVSDLVSLQERGSYNSIIRLAWVFSIAIGVHIFWFIDYCLSSSYHVSYF